MSPSSSALAAVAPEAHPGSDGARHGRDIDLVALDVDSDFLQHPLEAVVDPGRGTDLLAFDGSEITAPVALIGPHDQKPVHALSERAEQLRPLPCGKCGEHCVCGPVLDRSDLRTTTLLDLTAQPGDIITSCGR